MEQGDTITIGKDEYIDLLRYKAGAVDNLPSAPASALPANPEPRSWTRLAEQIEIIRLHSLGHLQRDIVKIVGRPKSTVSRLIKQYKSKVSAA